MSGARCTYFPLGATGAPVAGTTATLWTRHDEKWDGTSRLIVAHHGHGGGSSQYNGFHYSLGRFMKALVDTGKYVCLALDDGGDVWGGQAAQDQRAAGVAWARGKGCRPGRYGVMGYSMGGLCSGRDMLLTPAEIAAVVTFAGAMDLDYPWNRAGNSGWTSELAAVYGAYSAALDPRKQVATIAATGVPWLVVHATDDAVIPYDTAVGFVNEAKAANPASKIVLRQPDITGGHTGLFVNVGLNEIVAHYNSSTLWS